MTAVNAVVAIWSATPELRYRSTRGGEIPGTGGAAFVRKEVLEQKWVSDAGAVEWRPVPTVDERST